MTVSGENDEYFTHPGGRRCVALKDGTWIYSDGTQVLQTCVEPHSAKEKR